MGAGACAWLWITVGVVPGPSSAGEREVRYESFGAPIVASLLLPEASGRVPGVVIVHGSGDSDRSNPWTSAYAEALRARGIAVLHPDKRGCGKSGGDWKTVGFEGLAEDAARGVELLRGRPEVDPSWVGLIGFSQGVHVAPVCAAKTGGADFVVSVSGSVVPLLEQVVDETAIEASRRGVPFSAEQRETITALHVRAMEFARSGEGFEDLRSEIAKAASGSPAMAAAVRGFPADREAWVWKWMALVGEFDPMPHWKRVEAPILFVYGGRDERVDVAKSVSRLHSELGGSDKNWNLIELGLNGHALFREDALDFLGRWVKDRGKP